MIVGDSLWLPGYYATFETQGYQQFEESPTFHLSQGACFTSIPSPICPHVAWIRSCLVAQYSGVIPVTTKLKLAPEVTGGIYINMGGISWFPL